MWIQKSNQIMKNSKIIWKNKELSIEDDPENYFYQLNLIQSIINDH